MTKHSAKKTAILLTLVLLALELPLSRTNSTTS